MGRQASPWPAILTGPDQIPGVLRTLHPISGRYRHDHNGDVLDVNDPCLPLVACAHADKPA